MCVCIKEPEIQHGSPRYLSVHRRQNDKISNIFVSDEDRESPGKQYGRCGRPVVQNVQFPVRVVLVYER